MIAGCRAALARFMMAATAASALVPTLAFASGAIVRAGQDCGIGDPPYYDVTVTTKDTIFTHNLRYATLAPGAWAERTLTHSGTITGSITVTAGVKGQASVIFAQAEASLGIELKIEGSVTDSETFTLGVENNGSQIRDYVFFKGTRWAKGTWARWYCSVGTYKQSGYGTWKSWEAQIDGVLNCASDSAIKQSKGVWSIQYAAVASCP